MLIGTGNRTDWPRRLIGLALWTLLAAHAAQGARSAKDGAVEPRWAVPYGREAWRSAAGSDPVGFGIAEVRDRVGHALRPAGKGAHGLRTSVYRLDYGKAGMHFSPAGRTGATLGLTTESITAGGRAYALGRDRSWWVKGNTAQTLLSESLGAVEHHLAVSGGVEVVWYFPRRPAGAEKMAVTARLSGLACGDAIGEGFRCREGIGEGRVHIGDVTAVDSRGRAWPLPTRIDGNVLKVEVPEEVMAAAVFPLALDPLITPEFALHEPSIAGAYQSSASVASNGRDFLVVWTESYFDNRIWAARVRGDADGGVGTILDPEGINIAGFESYQCMPTVASNGTDYLVTWEDFTGPTGSDIFAARIRGDAGGTDGPMLYPTPIRVSGAEGEQTFPKVAAGGGDYLIVWEDTRGGSMDIYGTRMGGDGSVRDSTGMPLATDSGDQALPAVAYQGGVFLIAWEDYRNETIDIRGMRMRAADGIRLGMGDFAISAGPGDQSRPVLASGWDGFLAVWEDYRNGGTPDIYGSRMARAPGGEFGDDGVIDPEGIGLGRAAGYQIFPTAAFSGGAYLVAWEDYSSGSTADIQAVRINSLDASPIEPATFQSGPGDGYAPALAAKDGRFLVAYQSGSSITGLYRIRARFAAFDEDRDVDGVFDSRDNCPVHPNPDQDDLDGDGLGDACDPDDDNDILPDTADNCSRLANGDQLDNDLDGIGDACDPDDDADGFEDANDVCRLVSNPDQVDLDGDGMGDPCDADDDGDTVADAGDNCPLAANPGQEDRDQDGKGDACDPVMEVAIDIKPGCTPNTVNIGSGGVVPVAILGGPGFDASLVVATSVTLASAPVRMRGRSGASFTLMDLNGDGLTDMLLHISTETMVVDETDHLADLDGFLLDGSAIHGADLVRVMP